MSVPGPCLPFRSPSRLERYPARARERAPGAPPRGVRAGFPLSAWVAAGPSSPPPPHPFNHARSPRPFDHPGPAPGLPGPPCVEPSAAFARFRGVDQGCRCATCSCSPRGARAAAPHIMGAVIGPAGPARLARSREQTGGGGSLEEPGTESQGWSGLALEPRSLAGEARQGGQGGGRPVGAASHARARKAERRGRAGRPMITLCAAKYARTPTATDQSECRLAPSSGLSKYER